MPRPPAVAAAVHILERSSTWYLPYFRNAEKGAAVERRWSRPLTTGKLKTGLKKNGTRAHNHSGHSGLRTRAQVINGTWTQLNCLDFICTHSSRFISRVHPNQISLTLIVNALTQRLLARTHTELAYFCDGICDHVFTAICIQSRTFLITLNCGVQTAASKVRRNLLFSLRETQWAIGIRVEVVRVVLDVDWESG